MTTDLRRSPEPQSISSKRPRIFYGWVIVAVSMLADAIALGAGSASFGVFLRPMSDALGWSRTTFTGAVTVQSIANLVVNPIVGVLVDRHGPRVLMTVGALVAGICYLLMGGISEPWQFYILYAIAAALGLHEIGNLVTTATVSKWFVRMRGRVLAFTSIGNNLGQIIFTPLSALLIASLGWQSAWFVLGLIVLFVVPPTLLFMRRAPEDMGLNPDGDADDPPLPGIHTQRRRFREEPSWTPREALRTRALWLLVLSSNLASLAYSGILYHLLAYYTDIGLSLQMASFVIGLNHVFALFSKVPWGLLGERVPPRYCIAVNYLGRVAGLLILLLSNSPFRVYAYVAVSGSTSHGLAALQPLIWADYYGRAFTGTIRGFIAPFSLISSIGGPLFAAQVYDRLGSYESAFWVFVVTLTLAAFTVYFAKPPVRALPTPATDGSSEGN